LIPPLTVKCCDAMPTNDDVLMELLLNGRCEVLLSGGRHAPEWVTVSVKEAS